MQRPCVAVGRWYQQVEQHYYWRRKEITMNESKEKVYQNYLNELKRGIRSDELEAFEEKRVLDEMTEELEELKSQHAQQKKKYEDLQKSLQLQYKDFFNTYSAGIGAWKPDLIQNAEIV
ncbi:MAG: hypothetical protein LBQ54_08165, partial [Planctomycetaceae bacterium]|nr:hypothetical protein [Planctomycetaceae bacterium]